MPLKRPAMSEKMKEYFDTIIRDVESLYTIANEARKKGFDPALTVECPPAHDMAGRVENLVGPEGVGERIRKLKAQGLDQDQITFKIADEIVEGKLGKFKDNQDKVNHAIRVALAIKTEGVVSAPLEGISRIEIRKDPLGGPEYLAIYFAGPIRAAGGTVQAFCVLIADYVREKMKIAPWKATEDEIGRMVEEVKLYDKIVNLQYPSTQAELEFATKNLRIELNGDPTENREVSAYRDMKRIESNFVRSGPCLVLNDGVLLKSKKILKVIDKMKIPGWEWLKEVKKYSHSEDDNKVKEAENQKEGEYGSGLYDGKGDSTQNQDDGGIGKNFQELTPAEKRRMELDEKNQPVYKYIADVIGGRPVFAYPSRVGGHRIRYGRSRNTGLAACGMNPNTMYLLNEFLAVGTQIRIERPGKSASVMPVSSIEGPVVLHENGDVIQYNDPNAYRAISPENPIKRFLWIGDISFGFGEFAENNHTILPSGYVEEWWVLELEEALKNLRILKSNTNKAGDNKLDGSKLLKMNFSSDEIELIEQILNNPFDNIPSGILALKLSKSFSIPLHPKYLPHYGNANGFELVNFRASILNYYSKLPQKKESLSNIKLLKIPNTEENREFLYKIYCPHKNKGEYLEFDRDMTAVALEIYGLNKKLSKQESKDFYNLGKEKVALDLFPILTSIKIMDKAPYYMGTRMGRPEKAKERKMKPPVNVLFPMGHDTNFNRILQEALNSKSFHVDIAARKCPKCGKVTYQNLCPQCNEHTDVCNYCNNCHIAYDIEQEKCDRCQNYLSSYQNTRINFTNDFQNFLAKLNTSSIPNVKGVKGLSSQYKMPEPIEKGLLRAKHGVWIFKDGTVRFDALDIPFTHFTPNEINCSVEKLISLGYDTDYKGNPLTNPNQICELKVQDFIITNHCADYFVKVANFVDDELELIYGLPRIYNCSTSEDLIGHYFAGLAPHTSAAIVGRCIGFTPINAGYGHPYWHAAKRRNCDGDEDGLLLLMDLLLNFSRFYLPSKIGGKMDAPLVLSVTLDPNEVDGEAHNVDGLERYPLDFYKKTQEYVKPGKIEKDMGLLKARLGKPEQYEGIKFQLPTKNINYGPKLSSYKRMDKMDTKIESQLDLAVKIDAVDAADVAKKILKSHFTPDILGNLRSFGKQGFRCKCGAKYRRMPLSGRCLSCDSKLIMTVSKGGITKYLEKSLDLCNRFDLGNYTKQRFVLIDEYVKSLTDNPKVKQVKITSFFS